MKILNRFSRAIVLVCLPLLIPSTCIIAIPVWIFTGKNIIGDTIINILTFIIEGRI